jgi:hypothetical protein
VRPASWGPRPARRTLAGSMQPAPRKRMLRIERRDDGRFRSVTRVRTSRAGRYSVALSRAGAYRVRYGAVTGPVVRVR